MRSNRINSIKNRLDRLGPQEPVVFQVKRFNDVTGESWYGDRFIYHPDGKTERIEIGQFRIPIEEGKSFEQSFKDTLPEEVLNEI